MDAGAGGGDSWTMLAMNVFMLAARWQAHTQQQHQVAITCEHHLITRWRANSGPAVLFGTLAIAHTAGTALLTLTARLALRPVDWGSERDGEVGMVEAMPGSRLRQAA